MLRLPWFEHRAPRSVAEAAKILAGEGPRAMLIAGGTDLLPNMKRRHQAPQVLVSLREVGELRKLNGTFGAGLTLSEIAKSEKTPTALRQAAAQVATPHLRNMGTLGGNLCLDTRCTYYNQTYEWRKAIDFCLKKDGKTCWVATASKRCVAVSSTDTAPALIALNAAVTLVSTRGECEIPVAALYQNDGIDYLSRTPDEILTEARIPSGWKSTYWKLRRRGSFDFPILGVAAALKFSGDVVQEARIALGAVMATGPLLMVHIAGPLDGYVAGAIYGLGIGAMLTLLPVAWADYFGRSNYGAIRGVTLSAQVLAQATGPLASGALHDWTGNYTASLYLFAALAGLSVLAALGARRPVVS